MNVGYSSPHDGLLFISIYFSSFMASFYSLRIVFKTILKKSNKKSSYSCKRSTPLNYKLDKKKKLLHATFEILITSMCVSARRY